MEQLLSSCSGASVVKLRDCCGGSKADGITHASTRVRVSRWVGPRLQKGIVGIDDSAGPSQRYRKSGDFIHSCWESSLAQTSGGSIYGARKHRRSFAVHHVPRALTEDTSAAESTIVSEAIQAADEVEAQLKAETQIDEVDSNWNALTIRFADSATLAFLLLQLPQIILNTQNLLASNYSALSAIPWMGQLTGLLGNLSLLSYFAGKRERGAMVVQAVGVVSTLVVLTQLAIAGAMPLPAFVVTASAVALGLLLNFLNFQNMLSPAIWQLWGEVVSVGGVTVLPQVMWSTFQPYLPPSILPGVICGALGLTMVLLARFDRLPPKILKSMGSISSWTATLLFMWAPVAQAWSNFLNPANIKGLSVFTVLLAMLGNGLLLPRALFTRDLMWFTGSAWGTLLQGWGILLSMYIFECINGSVFWAVSSVLALWLGTMFVRDSKAYSLPSPLSSFIELLSGSRGTGPS